MHNKVKTKICLNNFELCLDLVCRQAYVKTTHSICREGKQIFIADQIYKPHNSKAQMHLVFTQNLGYTMQSRRAMYSQMHYTWVLLYLQKFPKQYFCTYFIWYVPEISTHKVFMYRKKDGMQYILHCDSIHFRWFFRTFLGGLFEFIEIKF